MVDIRIKPSHNNQAGFLSARGHAGDNLLCNTVTAIVECLAVNLEQCWDVRLRRQDNSGDYELRWEKSERKSRGIDRANRAAGFAYNGLKALSEEYPQALSVTWIREEGTKW